MYYQIIKKKNTNTKLKNKNSFKIKDGLYLTTFCDALNVVVITPYRLTISNLEKCLLKDHHLNVTFVQTHLEHVYKILNLVIYQEIDIKIIKISSIIHYSIQFVIS